MVVTDLPEEPPPPPPDVAQNDLMMRLGLLLGDKMPISCQTSPLPVTSPLPTPRSRAPAEQRSHVVGGKQEREQSYEPEIDTLSLTSPESSRSFSDTSSSSLHKLVSPPLGKIIASSSMQVHSCTCSRVCTLRDWWQVNGTL